MIKYETDSRKVLPGQTFVAIKGFTVDGHNFINDAIKNGATSLIVSEDVNTNIPTIKVDDTSKYLTDLLVSEYSSLFKDMKLIGITGTNGKTTTCYLIYQLLRKLGKKVAYIGTIGFYCEDEKITLNNTTPDILTLYKLLEKAKEYNCDTVVMEVSSHSLEENRIAGLKFNIAGFTNLSQDHLDYHKTMDDYLKAKLKIINYLKDDSTIIVNNDDEKGKYFLNNNAKHQTIGFKPSDFTLKEYDMTPSNTKITFTNLNKQYEVTTNLTSKFNVYNYMLALATVHCLGYEINSIIALTNEIKPPKGRCETYKLKKGYAVIDYAHTPDAVEKVISAYNELKKGRIITIIGCGGDRDPLKRPLMGSIATDNSDYVIFTNDNPRTEDPHKIMDDIINGVSKDNYEIIFDRKEAIKKGAEILEDHDVLLILGKGHEDYQIIGHEKIHLDDSEEVKKYI